MKKVAIALFLLFPALCAAQSDNTLYVKQFAGTTVGAKVTAAQASCNPNTLIPCILVIDPSLASWPAGTMPTLCGKCFLLDYRAGVGSVLPGVSSDGQNGIKVTGKITGMTSITSPKVNNTVSACSFAGSTFDAQINNAFASLPSSLGIVDASCLGDNTTYTASAPITLVSGQILKFSPATNIVPSSTSSNVVNMSYESSLSGLHVSLSSMPTTYTGCAVDYTGGALGAIQDITVDGATAGTGSALCVKDIIVSQGVGFLTVDGINSTGLQNPLYISASASGAWINANQFTNLNLIGSSTSPTTCVTLLNNGLEIRGNFFQGTCEGDGISGAIGISAYNNTGTSPIQANTLFMQIYDVTTNWKMVGGNVKYNFIQGNLDGNTSDNLSNYIINLLGGIPTFPNSISINGCPSFGLPNGRSFIGWDCAGGYGAMEYYTNLNVGGIYNAHEWWHPNSAGTGWELLLGLDNSGDLTPIGNYANKHGIVIPSTAIGYTGPAAGYMLSGITGNATLVSGTVTVSNAAACSVGSNCNYSLIHCGKNSSTGIGTLSVGTITAGTSFVINSLGPAASVLTTDVSTVCWQIN